MTWRKPTPEEKPIFAAIKKKYREEYYAKYPEKLIEKKARRRAWQERNKERIALVNKQYRDRTKEKIKAYNKQWWENNRDKRQWYRHSRLAKIGDVCDGTVTHAYVQSLYNKRKCYYCREYTLIGQRSIDHKQPIARGGLHSVDNLVMACRTCNGRKHAKTEDEFRKIMEMEKALKDGNINK